MCKLSKLCVVMCVSVSLWKIWGGEGGQNFHKAPHFIKVHAKVLKKAQKHTFYILKVKTSFKLLLRVGESNFFTLFILLKFGVVLMFLEAHASLELTVSLTPSVFSQSVSHTVIFCSSKFNMLSSSFLQNSTKFSQYSLKFL